MDRLREAGLKNFEGKTHTRREKNEDDEQDALTKWNQQLLSIYGQAFERVYKFRDEDNK